MTFEEKNRLARHNLSDAVSSALRLKAARKAVKLSQEQLGEMAGVGKTAISNMERAITFPSRDVIIYLMTEHRIDASFMMLGHYAHLPGDVQEALFAQLAQLANA